MARKVVIKINKKALNSCEFGAFCVTLHRFLMKIKKNMRKYVIALAAALLPTMGMFAQVNGAGNTDKWIKNVDASVTLGTTGVGVDVAVPINEIFLVRTGFSFTPRVHATMNFAVQVGDEKESEQVQAEKFNRLADMLEEYTGTRVGNSIDMVGTPTMNNFKLLVDVHPFRNKNWHFTTGFYWGPSQVAKAQNAVYDGTSLVAVSMYNNLYERVMTSHETQVPYIMVGDQGLVASDELYEKFKNYGRMGVTLGERKDGTPFRLEPDANNNVSATIKVNNFKPYLGFGYGGKLFKNSDDYYVSFDAGVLFWGGTPKIMTNDIQKVTFTANEDYTEAVKHVTTEPGVDLAKDVKNVPGKVGDYVDLLKSFKVYPVVELRLTRRIWVK